MLAVELARGKLNDIRNQLSDWVQMGLRSTPELDKALAEAQHAFVRSATSTDRPEACTEAARASLESASRAGDLLSRRTPPRSSRAAWPTTSKLSTHLGCVLDVSPQQLPRVDRLVERVQHVSTWESHGSSSRRRRASTAGTCSTPSWPGAARRAWRSRSGR